MLWSSILFKPCLFQSTLHQVHNVPLCHTFSTYTKQDVYCHVFVKFAVSVFANTLQKLVGEKKNKKRNKKKTSHCINLSRSCWLNSQKTIPPETSDSLQLANQNTGKWQLIDSRAFKAVWDYIMKTGSGSIILSIWNSPILWLLKQNEIKIIQIGSRSIILSMRNSWRD